MKFNNKFKTIFLDPNSDKKVDNSSLLIPQNSNAKREKVNIILSPSLYWVKKMSLPVKYVREVKKLLPSIFEDTLSEGNYSYSAYKSGEHFFVFAYEDKAILDLLSKQGISASNIANVYFAQSELDKIDGAIKVNETQSLYVKDSMVLLVPCCWIEEKGDLDLSTITPSRHKVTLKQFGHIVDNSSLYKIGAMLVILVVLVFTEYLITTQKTSYIEDLNSEIFVKHKLKSTIMQNKSLLNKYKKIHTTQTNFREYTSYILSLKLKSDEKLSKLTFKDKTISASFTGVKKDKDIINVFKSKRLKVKSTYKDEKLVVEIKL